MTERLDDRVALITGANHGIGAATAIALAARGAAVVITYLRLADEPDPGIPEVYRRNRAGGAEAVVAAIEEDGGRATAVEADLLDPGTLARLFDAAEQAYGTVDILINNATGWVADTFAPHDADRLGRTLQTVGPGTYERNFGVDARAPALLIAEFARRQVAARRGWGRIVSMISGGGLGFPEEVSYGAAKAALAHYTMSAAVELAPYGITANAVHPPVTDTGWVTDPVREFVAASREHHTVATPAEVAEVIAYLVTDAARLVTGNVLTLR
ncbi:MAG TPA: SDR family oxidoreductase [Actinoplanes sp.]|nr:SDR family oxidoreductase [Actinoplanes sp.]